MSEHRTNRVGVDEQTLKSAALLANQGSYGIMYVVDGDSVQTHILVGADRPADGATEMQRLPTASPQADSFKG